MKGMHQHGIAELFHISVTVSAVVSAAPIICMERGFIWRNDLNFPNPVINHKST